MTLAMHVRFCSWVLVGLLGAAAGCGGGSAAGPNGGSGSGGDTAAGGKSSGGAGGSVPPTQGGTTASGGVGSGGSAAGGTTGGSGGAASGGSAAGGSGGAASGGSVGTGGITGTGGRVPGTGGRGTGGTAATGGGAGGPGGRAQGGTTSSGGDSGSGGKATGGAPGTGGSTGYRPCPTGTACKIMPFGDSITDGYNADTPGGYRVELFRRAHAAGKNITFVGSSQNGPTTVDGVSFPRNHEGHSGWTIYPAGSRSGISTLLKNDGGSQSVMVKYTPDIVLLMIGTNDAIDNYDMTNAPKRLGDLIDTIYSQLPNVLIVVAQPIPSRGDASKGDDTALSARIKTYNDAIPAVVKARADAGKHILVVDMYTPFTPKASLIEDQWHPNLQGYVILGTEWYSVLQSLL
jgi:lysophospholipase L1-like esterase